jgi:hypothetical protein
VNGDQLAVDQHVPVMDGQSEGVIKLPVSSEPGKYTVQLNGIAKDGQVQLCNTNLSLVVAGFTEIDHLVVDAATNSVTFRCRGPTDDLEQLEYSVRPKGGAPSSANSWTVVANDQWTAGSFHFSLPEDMRAMGALTLLVRTVGRAKGLS